MNEYIHMEDLLKHPIKHSILLTPDKTVDRNNDFTV